MQKPLKFRPPGAPAGAWHHTPWWICVFCDPYERVNFWSHFIPGIIFVLAGLAAYQEALIGGRVLALFCACATTTHVLSALTHVYPDDHILEKIDHIGIIALIAGTPLTAVMARDPSPDYKFLLGATTALLLAAFLRPLWRTISFVAIGAAVFYAYLHVVDLLFVTECLLYAAGAFCFIRNAGHNRWQGFSDHHFLHYTVTAACLIHVVYIQQSMSRLR